MGHKTREWWPQFRRNVEAELCTSLIGYVAGMLAKDRGTTPFHLSGIVTDVVRAYYEKRDGGGYG